MIQTIQLYFFIKMVLCVTFSATKCITCSRKTWKLHQHEAKKPLTLRLIYTIRRFDISVVWLVFSIINQNCRHHFCTFFSLFLHVVVVVVFIHLPRYRAKALVFCAFSYFAIALSPRSETCLIYVNADFSRLMLVMIAANKYNPFSMFPFIIFPFHMI